MKRQQGRAGLQISVDTICDRTVALQELSAFTGDSVDTQKLSSVRAKKKA